MQLQKPSLKSTSGNKQSAEFAKLISSISRPLLVLLLEVSRARFFSLGQLADKLGISRVWRNSPRR